MDCVFIGDMNGDTLQLSDNPNERNHDDHLNCQNHVQSSVNSIELFARVTEVDLVHHHTVCIHRCHNHGFTLTISIKKSTIIFTSIN